MGTPLKRFTVMTPEEAARRIEELEAELADARLLATRHFSRIGELETELDGARRDLKRILFVAEHLFQMIPQGVWRDQGGEMWGQYEGDYWAEQTLAELKAMREKVGE